MPYGLTIYLCIGKYAGWALIHDGPSIRLVLGWVSFSVGFLDIERASVKIMEKCDELRNELKRLEA